MTENLTKTETTTKAAATRARHVVTLSTYNTIEMESDHVYELVTPYSGTYAYNVLNLGPCTVYIRADDDPDPDDPESETLPPRHADNGILVPDGPAGLRFVVGPPCEDEDGNGDDRPRPTVITVRLVRG